MMRAGTYQEPDRYELVERRSQGGEGALWKGRLDAGGVTVDVAVKVIHPRSIGDIDEWRRRWQSQAELLRSLDHPGLVKVRDVFEGPEPHEAGRASAESKSLFLVMNWVEGENLEEWVARNPRRDPRDVALIVTKLAEVVDYLHHNPIGGVPVLHRDIKPANVIVAGTNVTLVDFGLVRVLNDQPLSQAIGTPRYWAPEVAVGYSYTEAADRFSLGATAFFAFTGEAPDPGNPAHNRELLMATAPPENAAGFADHVLAMLDPNPASRPSSPVAWARALAVGSMSGQFLGLSQVPTVVKPPGQAPTVPVTPTTPTPPPPPAASLPPPPYAQAPAKKSRKPVAIIAAVVAVLLVAGLAGALLLAGGGDDGDQVSGAATTAAAADDQSDATAATTSAPTTSPPTTAATTTTTEPVLVPSIYGKSAEEAQSELAALGSNVTVVEEEGVKPFGQVVKSDPAPGSALAPGQVVTLYVHKPPAAMPSVVGSTADDAVKTLDSYGVAVSSTETLDESKADNTVIDQTPKPGEPFSSQAQLVVSRQPAIKYLADLDVLYQGHARFDTGQAQVNGVVYTRSVTISSGAGYDVTLPGFLEYDLARKYKILDAVLGPKDTVKMASSLRIEVFADGVRIYQRDFKLGESVSEQLDVANVLRLRLQVTQLNESAGYGDFVFADARLLGVPGEVSVATTTG